MINSNKDIIAIFPQLPLPEFAGDRQMVNNLIKVLSKKYLVHAIIICRENHTNDDEIFLKQYCHKFKIFKLSKIDIFISCLKGILKQESLQINFFYQSHIDNYIKENMIDKHFILYNLIRTSKYAANYNGNKIMVMVDLISLNYQRSLEKVHSTLWKIFYKYENKHIEEAENKVILNFKATFLANHNEQTLFAAKFKKVFWLPIGIKEQLFNYPKNKNNEFNSIVFIGKMDYAPNVDAVIWFVKNVFQHLNNSIKFYIVGARPLKKVIALSNINERIIVTGYVQDPYELMNRSAVVVSPMQTGGGIQNKILEGMALGKVNVVTSLGASSIYLAENNKHLLIEDNSIKMAKLINQIVENPQQFQNIGIEGKKLVTKIYTWKNFGDTLTKQIEESIK